ncbi:unnamed protein product [marine sediment metagenome]|uniref:Uncharacterized protein n=1 Tax=marine sediment metagenome TaxID=412755 RepID=X0UM71_9ZZZZ
MKFNNNGETVLETDQETIDAFLDYTNNFLTVWAFADHYGWTDENAKQILIDGKQLHEGSIQ